MSSQPKPVALEPVAITMGKADLLHCNNSISQPHGGGIKHELQGDSRLSQLLGNLRAKPNKTEPLRGSKQELRIQELTQARLCSKLISAHHLQVSEGPSTSVKQKSELQLEKPKDIPTVWLRPGGWVRL